MAIRRRGHELVVSEAEQPVVRLAKDLRSQGRSYRSICDALAEAGLKPRRGLRWHPAVVRDIVGRPSPPNVSVAISLLGDHKVVG